MTRNTDHNQQEKLSRADSSRINGAQSKGPTSQAGKERSSLNRTTHGMYSRRVVLHNECRETYDDLADRFLVLFQPNDILESELVYNLVNSRWRIRRLEAASTAALDLAIAENRPDFEERYKNVDGTHENALAYRALAQTSGNADLMGRHEDRQHRIFERSYRLLAKHRGKHNALPSNEDLLRAESDLPPDNLPVQPSRPVQNLLRTESDIQNEGSEPETPPGPVVTPEKAEETRKQPRNPDCAYEEDYKILKPLFDAFDAEHPELCDNLAKIVTSYQNRMRNQAA